MSSSGPEDVELKIPRIIGVDNKTVQTLNFNATYRDLPYTEPSLKYGQDESPPIGCTGYCDSFDMRNPEERQKYADLTAKFTESSQEYERNWERPVEDGKGGLILYVSYYRFFYVNKENLMDKKNAK